MLVIPAQAGIQRLWLLLRVSCTEHQVLDPDLRRDDDPAKALARDASAPDRHFKALNRNRCGFAPSSPRRRFLSSSYSR